MATAEDHKRNETDTEPETINIDGNGGYQSTSYYGGYETGSAIQIFYEDDGWYWCFDGVSDEGLYYEGDNVGPFDTRDEARKNALSYV